MSFMDQGVTFENLHEFYGFSKTFVAIGEFPKSWIAFKKFNQNLGSKLNL